MQGEVIYCKRKRMVIKDRESRLKRSDIAFPEEEGFQSIQIGFFFLFACQGSRGMPLKLCSKPTVCSIYICNSFTKEVCQRNRRRTAN